MLEFGWIPSMHRYRGSIHMQLPHNTASALIAFLPDQLWTEGSIIRAFPQPQQTDQDITLWILVRQECFPAAISSIIPPEEFDRLWPDFVMNFVNLMHRVRRKKKTCWRIGFLPRLHEIGRLGTQHRSLSCDSAPAPANYLNFRSHCLQVAREYLWNRVSNCKSSHRPVNSISITTNLCTRYTRVHGGTNASIRATTSTSTLGV